MSSSGTPAPEPAAERLAPDQPQPAPEQPAPEQSAPAVAPADDTATGILPPHTWAADDVVGGLRFLFHAKIWH